MSRRCPGLNPWCSERQSRPVTVADRRSVQLTSKGTVYCSALTCGTCDTQGIGVFDENRDHISVHLAVGPLDALWPFFGK